MGSTEGAAPYPFLPVPPLTVLPGAGGSLPGGAPPARAPPSKQPAELHKLMPLLPKPRVAPLTLAKLRAPEGAPGLLLSRRLGGSSLLRAPAPLLALPLQPVQMSPPQSTRPAVSPQAPHPPHSKALRCPIKWHLTRPLSLLGIQATCSLAPELFRMENKQTSGCPAGPVLGTPRIRPALPASH